MTSLRAYCWLAGSKCLSLTQRPQMLDAAHTASMNVPHGPSCRLLARARISTTRALNGTIATWSISDGVRTSTRHVPTWYRGGGVGTSTSYLPAWSMGGGVRTSTCHVPSLSSRKLRRSEELANSGWAPCTPTQDERPAYQLRMSTLHTKSGLIPGTPTQNKHPAYQLTVSTQRTNSR